MRIDNFTKLFLEILFFLVYIISIYFVGSSSNFLLIISIVFLLLGMAFFHTRKEIIRIISAVLIMTIVEIFLTGKGIYTYTYKEFYTIPIWLPVGWAFFVLITFRIIDIIDATFKIKSDIIKKEKDYVLILEGFLFIFAIFVLQLIWHQTALSLFIITVTIILLSIIYYTKMDHVLIIVSIIVASILEYAGILGHVWKWTASDVYGLPLWVPLAYAFIILMVHRISLEVEKKLYN